MGGSLQSGRYVPSAAITICPAGAMNVEMRGVWEVLPHVPDRWAASAQNRGLKASQASIVPSTILTDFTPRQRTHGPSMRGLGEDAAKPEASAAANPFRVGVPMRAQILASMFRE